MSQVSKSHKFIIIGGLILCVILLGVIVFLSLNKEETTPNSGDASVTTTLPADPVLQDINVVLDDEEGSDVDLLTIVETDNSVQGNYLDPIITSDFIKDDIADDGSSSDADLAFLANYKETHPTTDTLTIGGSDNNEDEDAFQQRLNEILNNPTVGMTDDMVAFLGDDFVIAQSGDDVLDMLESGVASAQNVEDWMAIQQAEMFDERGIVDTDPNTFDSCGIISIDVDSDSTEQEIISKLSNDSSALCVGNEFLNDCGATTVTYGGYTYLLDSVDGVCSIGKMTSGFADICATSEDPDDYSSDLSDREIATIVYKVFTNQTVTDCSIYRY